MPVFILCLLLLASHTVFSADWKSIDGIYAVTAESYLDPSDDEPKDSHYRFQLKGVAAKELYQAMKVVAVTDECTGGLAKTIGEMQCLFFQSGNTYECHFSINIAKQSIHYGVAC